VLRVDDRKPTPADTRETDGAIAAVMGFTQAEPAAVVGTEVG
jgi:hypothetical protein